MMCKFRVLSNTRLLSRRAQINKMIYSGCCLNRPRNKNWKISLKDEDSGEISKWEVDSILIPVDRGSEGEKCQITSTRDYHREKKNKINLILLENVQFKVSVLD